MTGPKNLHNRGRGQVKQHPGNAVFKAKPGLLIWVILLLLWQIPLVANLRAPFVAAEKSYNSGNLDDFASLLLGLKPGNDEERAFISYYSAMIEADGSKAKTILSQLGCKFLPLALKDIAYLS